MPHVSSADGTTVTTISDHGGAFIAVSGRLDDGPEDLRWGRRLNRNQSPKKGASSTLVRAARCPVRTCLPPIEVARSRSIKAFAVQVERHQRHIRNVALPSAVPRERSAAWGQNLVTAAYRAGAHAIISGALDVRRKDGLRDEVGGNNAECCDRPPCRYHRP